MKTVVDADLKRLEDLIINGQKVIPTGYRPGRVRDSFHGDRE